MSGINKKLASEIFSFFINSEEYKSYGYYKGRPFHGGERVEDFDARVKQAFDYIARQKHDTVAIVTHGGVFRSLYRKILNRSEEIKGIDFVATIEIEHDGNNFNIVSMSGIKTE